MLQNPASFSKIFILVSQFNLQAIQEDHPRLHMQSPDPEDHMVSVEEQIRRQKAMGSLFGSEQEVDCSDITEPRCLDNVEELSSPIKNMSYKDFYQGIRTYLGWKGTGSISCADKDVQWIANEEHYAHLHLMAKNNAIAAITLDVSDTPSCKQLRQHLENVEYNPIQMVDGELVTLPTRQGALIGNMYLSNVLYYLNYSPEEMDECRAKGGKPCDFSGNEVSTNSFATTLDNLRSLADEDATVLRFDRIEPGSMGRPDFNPLFSITNKNDIRIPRLHEPNGLVLP